MVIAIALNIVGADPLHKVTNPSSFTILVKASRVFL